MLSRSLHGALAELGESQKPKAPAVTREAEEDWGRQ